MGDKAQHLKQAFLHITKGWKRQIIIFMDNVDQRDDHIQEDAFFIANEIAANWPAVVFITLRPSTYSKSKKIGALTGYHPKAFTIAPPRISEVIYKRLNFATKIASGEINTSFLSGGLGVKLHVLTQFIEVLSYSFTQNNSLIEFIDNVCAGNVRKAIEYLAIFIGSGHINTEKILQKDSENRIQQFSGRYIVSLHEFLRAIIFREHIDFLPDETDIVNLFEITQDAREHFITPIYLDYLLRYSHQGQDGFILTEKIVQALQDEGFKTSQIDYCILRSIFRGLVQTEGRKVLNVGDPLPHACRITTAGSYHIQKLVFQFVYIDAMIIDTPITSEDFRKGIGDVQYIVERLDRAIVFCDYLTDVWSKSAFTKTGFNWTEVCGSVKHNIIEIKNRVHR